MSKLNKYSEKSRIMDVKIIYNGERIKFNLYQEMKVDEGRINKELTEQPTHYAFLSMLQTRLARSRDDALMEFEKTEARLYVQYKSDLNPNTHREYPKDTIEMLVRDDEEYVKALQNYNESKDSYRVITSCVKAYEQRKDLIQSLSANIRNTK